MFTYLNEIHTYITHTIKFLKAIHRKKFSRNETPKI